MSKVITFSRTFPAYHPKAGQPTYFVEKLYNSFNVDALGARFFEDKEEELWGLNRHLHYDVYMDFRDALVKGRTEKFTPKYHTIRGGHRFKVGDKFSPRVWSGKPYNSKQIIIAPDIEVKKVWDIVIFSHQPTLKCLAPDLVVVINKQERRASETFGELSQNDGLYLDDFIFWFMLSPDFRKNKNRFKGQIICWNENVNY